MLIVYIASQVGMFFYLSLLFSVCCLCHIVVTLHQIHCRWHVATKDENSSTITIKVGRYHGFNYLDGLLAFVQNAHRCCHSDTLYLLKIDV